MDRGCQSSRSSRLLVVFALLLAAALLFDAPLGWILAPGLRSASRSQNSRIARYSMGDEPLPLTEENVEAVLEDLRWNQMGHMMGYEEDSLKVGINGKVDLVSVEGPVVVVALNGNFWHPRADVLARLEVWLMRRIPELAAVEVEDPKMLIDKGRDRQGKTREERER
eukprot:TRINITY_DN63487_c0_g1_i1.p1 TRINITY_DN63487_c0_g1~~TRINITY_DN63487_c0_g1_i1.p1  ORF type:complete len:167 (+),score=33.10 TRINITY_DN63487_c0_g1_i1:83-583(+)